MFILGLKVLHLLHGESSKYPKKDYLFSMYIIYSQCTFQLVLFPQNRNPSNEMFLNLMPAPLQIPV